MSEAQAAMILSMVGFQNVEWKMVGLVVNLKMKEAVTRGRVSNGYSR